jgi:two-component system response regulator HydG
MAEIDRILVGESAAMRGLREHVGRLAHLTSPVLVQGERGTGKAAVAHALHVAGARCDGPLVQLDCGGRPDDELAYELFGDAAAVPCRKGQLARAQGGTLVVREIGATGPVVQAGLLRTLRSAAADVRIIATTVHDLGQLVVDGDFPGELLDRLAPHAVTIPPLRDRPEDVPALCRHFLSMAGRRERIHPRSPDGATLDLFRRYAWRRNVRELQNFVERACTVDATDDPLRVEVVEPWLRAAAIDPVAATVEALAGKPLADIEKQVILSTLQQFRGHRIKTAGALGIGVRTLGIKLKRWRDEGEPVDGRSRSAG